MIRGWPLAPFDSSFASSAAPANPTPNGSYWETLSLCQTQTQNTTQHHPPTGFGVLPSSAYSRKARDGCCNSDVHVRDRGFDWVWQGYENGTEQRQCIELMSELSLHNKSLVFIGDSMNNQVFTALIEECVREGIDGAFDGGAKGGMDWVQNPEAFGLTRKTLAMVGGATRLDLRGGGPVYIYAIDVWYGRRSVYDERLVMEVLIPLLCRNHAGGLVILPNIGHHLESERAANNFHGMVSTVSGFLDWMHELTKINWGKNLVAFRETTPSHFDSPDLDGSFEKWRGAGRSNYDYMAKNSWDGTLYHCRSIDSSANATAKNTLENLVVADIIKTWGRKRSSLQVLPVFKYLAPFYRLKYGFCGGYDRIPVLDCVHFCAWGPTMWIPVWDGLLQMVRNFTSTHGGQDLGGRAYEPVFGRRIVEEVVILRQHADAEEQLFLFYHGVRHFALNWHSIEEELGLLRNSSAFPPVRNVTLADLSKILLGSPIEEYPVLKDGLALQAHGDGQIWYLLNGTRHTVPNWDTFCALGFTRGSIVHVSSNVLERIGVGDGMPPKDWPTSC